MTDSKTSGYSDKKTDDQRSAGRGADEMKAKEHKGNEDEPMVARYFTEDGVPVEPSTIPAKQTIGEPDLDARPDVHECYIPAKKGDVRNESELDEDKDSDNRDK